MYTVTEWINREGENEIEVDQTENENQNTENTPQNYESPVFPASPSVSGVTYVEPVYSTDQVAYFNLKNAVTDRFMNDTKTEIIGVQNNLTVVNNSIASLQLEITDQTQQINLLTDQLDTLKNIYGVVSLFYFLFLWEWIWKHLKSWRFKSSNTAK